VVAAVLVVTAWFALACALMVLSPGTAPTVTAALPAVAADGRRRRGAGTAQAALVVVGVVGAAVAVAAFGALAGGSGVPGTKGQLVAYGAGVAAIGAACAFGFAVQLALREAVGRAWDVPRNPDGAPADER
jgi:hypothetical protein